MQGTLIVRLPNWLGDTVMAVPMLRALRAGLPAARLAAAGPWVQTLRGQDLADVLVTYPRSWSGRLRTADTVRGLAPDVALLLPNSLEAGLAARYWRARRRVGYAAGGRSWLLTDALALPSPRLHQIDEYLALLAPLDVQPVGHEPRLAPPPADGEARAEARRLLAEAGAPLAPGRRVGIHLGAAFGPSKLWPSHRIAELCRLLERDGAPAILLGTRDNVAVVAAITARAPAVSLVGRDRPELLPAVLTELDALVCGDTGVGHLAAALGIPVVALFGPTDPRLTAPRGPAEVVRHAVPCAPCFYRRCPIDHPCLDGVAAADVRARLFTLLAGARP